MTTSEPEQTAEGLPAEYRVELDVYNGPLDLLLYLIRRDEVDIYDIPIADVAARYVAHVELLRRVDPDAVGDFLVMAATLMEIKSRTLLPRPPAIEEEEDFTDPRMELVHQLLEYKRFKDAARDLGTAAELQSMKFPRRPVVPRSDSPAVDLEDVQLWDLVEAFRSVLAEIGQRELAHEVVDDDTPIALHATDVLDSLERAGGTQLFEAIFAGRTKTQLIGLFLALLELLRQNRVRAVQESPFSSISIQLIDATPIEVNEDRDYASHEVNENEEEDDEATDPHAEPEDIEAESAEEQGDEQDMVGLDQIIDDEIGPARGLKTDPHPVDGPTCGIAEGAAMNEWAADIAPAALTDEPPEEPASEHDLADGLSDEQEDVR